MKGLIWTLLESYGIYGVRFFISLYLAAIIDVEIYAEFAVILAISYFSVLIGDLGFSIRIMRREGQKVIHQWFILQIMIALFVSSLITILYNMKIYMFYIYLITLLTVISDYVQNILVVKAEYKKNTKISFVGIILSTLTTLLLLLFGIRSVHILMIPLITYLLIRSFIGYLNIKRDLNLLKLNQLKIKSLVNQFINGLKHYKIFITSYIDNFSSRIIVFYLKKDPIILGNYSFAQNIENSIVHQFSYAINKFTIPEFSKKKNEPKIFSLYKKSTYLILAFGFLVFILFNFVIPPLFIFFYKDKWESAINLIKLLSLSSFLYGLITLNLNFLLAKNKDNLYYIYDIINKFLMLLLVLLTILININVAIIIYGFSRLIFYIFLLMGIKKVYKINIDIIRTNILSLIIISISYACVILF